MKTRSTVVIRCSQELAVRLGAVLCSEENLSDKRTYGFKNFQIIPVDSMGHGVFWRWEVVHPDDGREYMLP